MCHIVEVLFFVSGLTEHTLLRIPLRHSSPVLSEMSQDINVCFALLVFSLSALYMELVDKKKNIEYHLSLQSFLAT